MSICVFVSGNSYYLNNECYLFQVTHKFPYSVLGSMGGVAWKIQHGVFASKLFVRWSIPFIFGSTLSNRMDVSFTEVEDPNWYTDITHNCRHHSTYHFGKFRLNLSGYMRTGQRTIITLSLRCETYD